jgi:nucleotidyltransferase substrate binding protein (TIGR01987 family)
VSAGSDIRWRQRLDSYCRALAALERAVKLARERPLSELEEQGLIQGFEFTHELAWNVLKDYLEYQGAGTVHGSRDATRLAFRDGLISQGETWMAMIAARNQTSHTYNPETARSIARQVVDAFFPELVALRAAMDKLAGAS